MQCPQHAAHDRFRFAPEPFEALANDGFGAGSRGLAGYLARYRPTSRGTGPLLALLIAEAKLAGAISGPSDLTFTVHAVRHDCAVVAVAGILGHQQTPQITSSPQYLHPTSFADLEQLVATIGDCVQCANALVPYHRRLISNQRHTAHPRCTPARRRRGCPQPAL